MDVEGWRLKDEGWKIKDEVLGFLVTDRLTDGRTSIGDSRVAFTTEKIFWDSMF